MGHRAMLNVRSDDITTVEVMCNIYQEVIEIIRGKEVKSGKKASDVRDIRGAVLGKNGDAGAVVRECRTSQYGILQTEGNMIREERRDGMAANTGRHKTGR